MSSLTLDNGPAGAGGCRRGRPVPGGRVHAATVIPTAQGPVQIVHGGTYDDLQWLVIDVIGEDLRLTLESSRTQLRGSGVIWAATGPRANNRPVAGSVETIGTAWMDGDGWYEGDGELVEGPTYE